MGAGGGLFLAGHEISAVAFATDNEVMNREVVQRHRLGQAAAIAKGRQPLVDANPEDPRLGEIDALLDRVAGLPGRGHMSDDDFIQSQQVPELVMESIQRACQRYREPEWDADFQRFEFVFDAKHRGRLKAGEKYVDENLERMIGSTARMKLDVPGEWADSPEHPFRAFDDPSGQFTMLSEILGSRRWGSSEEDNCLQLADVVAGTVRSVIESGGNSPRWAAYQKLRMVLTDIDGYCLRVYRFRGAPEADVAWYVPLMRAWPRPASATRVSASGGVLL